MINNLLHKPWFFIVSIFVILLLSLCTWSLSHGGKPFTGVPNQQSKSMRGTRNSYGGRQINFSGENSMGSGGVGYRRSIKNMTGIIPTLSEQE